MRRSPDFRRLDTRIAYPWPVEVIEIEDVSDLSLDEILYPSDLIGAFVIGRDEIGDDL